MANRQQAPDKRTTNRRYGVAQLDAELLQARQRLYAQRAERLALSARVLALRVDFLAQKRGARC